jgi:uncharacterized membrane protein YdbT with pleckstrin-like domain
MNPTKITITPSQWVNIGWFILAIAGASQWIFTGNPLWGIPILLWLYNFAVVECHRYVFDEDNEVFIERKGVFSVQTVEIHYFRIKSIQIKKPFLMRLVGISTVEVITSEPFKPFLRLYAINNGDEWLKYVQDMAAYWRKEKGVKETDFHAF